MELRLKFYLFLYYKASFEIINPSTVPAEGELLFFHWEDFFDDQDTLDTIRKHTDEHGDYLAHIESRKYSTDGAIVTISLMTPYDYHKYEAENKEYIAESLKAGHMIDIDD